MNKTVIGVGVAILSAAAGYAAGYFYATRKVIPDLEEQVEILEEDMKAEIRKSKEYYKRLYKVGPEFDTPEDVLQRRTPKTPEGFEHETPEEVEARAYDNNGALKDFRESFRTDKPFNVNPPKAGVKKRDKTFGHELPEDPGVGPKGTYIITEADYMAGELGYMQVSLTYYGGDGIVADTDDQPIEDHVSLIGPRALNSFGKKSSNPNVVYVRNEVLCVDYEIAYTDMTYGEAVGLPPEE